MQVTIDAIEFHSDAKRRTAAPKEFQIEDSHIVSIRPISPEARVAGTAPQTANTGIILKNPAEERERVVFIQPDLKAIFNADDGARPTKNSMVLLAHSDKVDFQPIMPRELGGVRFTVTNPAPVTPPQPA